MELKVGLAVCGSFCTFHRALEQMEELTAEGMRVTPILSYCAATTDTRFGTAREWQERFATACGERPLLTLPEVEPIGPKGYFDVLAVAPCTGSTLGRLANGISDTPVTLAVKSQLRRGRPVVIAVSTNDALGFSMRNIAVLKNSKHLYFVPMSQDDAANKPNSLVADFTKLSAAIHAAQVGVQLQPLFE